MIENWGSIKSELDQPDSNELNHIKPLNSLIWFNL